MSEVELVHYTSQSLALVLYLSLPVIAVAALVGVSVGLLQALTQIQDQTFSFVFKLVAVIVMMIFAAGWAGAELRSFALSIFEAIPEIRR